MNNELIIGIDIGTSSCKAVLFDCHGNAVAWAKESYPLFVLGNGYVEQNAEDYWTATVSCVRRLVSADSSYRDRIKAIGLTGQVPTDIFLDENGSPLIRGISWQDTRAVKQAEMLRERYTAEEMYKILGSNVPISPSWSASRLLWVTQNLGDVAKRCKKIVLPKDYVGFKMTGGYMSDGWSCKSTVNLHNNTPCSSLLEYLGFSDSHMPEVASWSTLRGTLTKSAAETLGLSAKTVVSNGCSDAPATMLGCGVLSAPGIGFNSCGTSEIVGMSIDSNAMCRELMTIPSTVTGACSIIYGPTQSGGNSLLWYANNILNTNDVDALLANAEKSPTGCGGLMFIPYISGERCPLWEPDVRGSFVSISASHTSSDFARAIMEGVGFSVRHCLEFATKANQNIKPSVIRVTGGGSRSALWRQIKADITGVPIETLKCDEACALGAAMTAAVGTSLFSSYPEASSSMLSVSSQTLPNPDAHTLYSQLFTNYLQESTYSIQRITRGMR